MKKKLTSLSAFTLVFHLALAQPKIEQWDRFELTLKHTSAVNHYLKVNLSATFTGKDTSYTVAGFYDGNDTFKIRFMPQTIGTWQYTTRSNIPELNNKKGILECVKASGSNHGMVKVSSDKYNFNYADGKRYYPFGTTAYAWTHMGQGLQEMTLNTLKNAGFNKIRMCVFPKNYELVKEEPELYPFLIKGTAKDSAGNDKKIWDFERFNPAFFQHLEKRIDDLRQLGIEADLILFHPYDKGRWGFDAMPNDVNVRYITYITARLASFRNVWWSLANEFDYVKDRSLADWDMLSQKVVASDPYRHLCSIHGSTAKYYEYWKPEFTHTSIQDEAPVSDFGRAAILRNVYYKPVIYDEVCYEGNLKSRWGRLSGEEMTHFVWQGVLAGTYVTHGESFMFKNAQDTIFWAKGGQFKGTGWKRIGFLRKILEEGPGPLELADISRDNRTACAGMGHYLIYFGKEMMDSWVFNLPAKTGNYGRVKAGTRFKVEIIDTWDMTIQPYPGVFEVSTENDYRMYDKGLKKIRLPLKPYMALRITEIP